MGRRDDLIETYAEELRTHCGVDPDMDLLRKVTIACGPSIYRSDAALVAASDPEELKRVRENFLKKRLGLSDDHDLMGGIQSVIDTYGRSRPRKYRAVVYYLLVRHFDREDAYA